MRVDNLYLVGFKTTTGVWWEYFNNEQSTHPIGGSRWLGFSSWYEDLVARRRWTKTTTTFRYMQIITK